MGEIRNFGFDSCILIPWRRKIHCYLQWDFLLLMNIFLILLAGRLAGIRH